MEVKIAEFGSDIQKSSILLRDALLRKPLGLEFTKKELEEEFDQTHIVALEEGGVVGVLLLKPITPTEVKMRQVAVLEEKQGKGIGKKMVSFAESFSRQLGFKKIALHARKEPVQFYLGLDYLVVGDEFEEVGIPHFRMEKVI